MRRDTPSGGACLSSACSSSKGEEDTQAPCDASAASDFSGQFNSQNPKLTDSTETAWVSGLTRTQLLASKMNRPSGAVRQWSPSRTKPWLGPAWNPLDTKKPG